MPGQHNYIVAGLIQPFSATKRLPRTQVINFFKLLKLGVANHKLKSIFHDFVYFYRSCAIFDAQFKLEFLMKNIIITHNLKGSTKNESTLKFELNLGGYLRTIILIKATSRVTLEFNVLGNETRNICSEIDRFNFLESIRKLEPRDAPVLGVPLKKFQNKILTSFNFFVIISKQKKTDERIPNTTTLC